MVLSQTLIVASASTFILSLMTTASVYLYAEYARPETSDPETYEKELAKKLKTINETLQELQNADNSPSLAKSIQSGTKKLPVTLVEGDARRAPEDPVKILFKTISSTAAKLEKDNKQPAESDDSVHLIEKIQFPSELGKSQTLLRELSTESIDPSSVISNEVIVSQVGLSLRRPNIFAAVYKIQNIFNTPGKVGHLFVMQGFDDLKTPFKFDLKKFNLLNKTPEPNLIHKFDESSNFELQIVTNNRNMAQIMAKYCKYDEKDGKAPHLNPYKWLNLAMFFTSHFEPNELVYALLTPKFHEENPDVPAYSEDVELFPLDLIQGDKIDSVLHMGDAVRVLNHCKDYLPEANLSEL